MELRWRHLHFRLFDYQIIEVNNKGRIPKSFFLIVLRHVARAIILKKGHLQKQRKNTGIKGGKA